MRYAGDCWQKGPTWKDKRGDCCHGNNEGKPGESGYGQGRKADISAKLGVRWQEVQTAGQ